MQVNTFSVTLVESAMISSKVKHFNFSCDPAFTYIPGQFITVHFEYQGKLLKRSYSIANQPNQGKGIEFAAGYVENGPGTQFLFNLKPGDQIQISGPYGRLTLKDTTPKRYILVATSTGITPFRAMFKELSHRLKSQPELQVVILQGVQKREDILYLNEFLAFAKAHSQVQFRPYYSREALHQLEAQEYSGYVQNAFVELQLKPDEDVVYLCGNPSMIDDAFNALKEKGFTTQQVIREKYISN